MCSAAFAACTEILPKNVQGGKIAPKEKKASFAGVISQAALKENLRCIQVLSYFRSPNTEQNLVL